jgi:peptidoglycan/LPS O-acetylase OafA/YrhL
VNTDFYTNPGYYWTYLVNYWIELHGNWADALSPYWSLSVEEQFYVVWPFCMLLLASRHRAYFLWFTVVFGVVYRYFSVHVYGGLGVSMFSCVDTFAWGALLAHYLRAGKSAELSLWIKRLIIPAVFCFLMLCLKHTDGDLVKQLFFRTFASMVSVAMLFYAMQQGLLARIFAVQPLRVIGQMSYGLYLYHMLVPDLFFQLMARLGIHVPALPYNLIPIVVLGVTAYVSYRLIELPIQSLKRYFQA